MGVHPASWGLRYVFDIESRVEFRRCSRIGDDRWFSAPLIAPRQGSRAAKQESSPGQDDCVAARSRPSSVSVQRPLGPTGARSRRQSRRSVPHRCTIRTDFSMAGSGVSFLNCPRCGLSIPHRTHWLAIEYCPRCLGRAGIAVKLFSSPLAAGELYCDGVAPGCRPAAGTTGDGAGPRVNGVSQVRRISRPPAGRPSAHPRTTSRSEPR